MLNLENLKYRQKVPVYLKEIKEKRCKQYSKK